MFAAPRPLLALASLLIASSCASPQQATPTKQAPAKETAEVRLPSCYLTEFELSTTQLETNNRRCDNSGGPDARACYVLGRWHFSKGEMQQARARYERGCDAGDQSACWYLSSMYEEGEGGPVDQEGSYKILEHLCQDDHAGACYNQGLMALHGEHVAEDKALALRLLTRSCELGYNGACGSAGELALELANASDSIELAKQYLERGCQGGDDEACHQLARALYFGDKLPEDHTAAHEHFARLCDARHAEACLMLGSIEANTNDDARTALAHYKRSCDLGDGEGCFYAGATHALLYNDGNKSCAFFTRGCNDHEWGASCTMVGHCVYQGIHGEPKDDVAKLYLERGCDLGSGLGCAWLGNLYKEGVLASPDPNLSACELYTKGCEADEDDEACAREGECFMEGIGRPVDADKALERFIKGCDALAYGACALLGNVYMQQGNEQLAMDTWTRGCKEAEDAQSCLRVAEHSRGSRRRDHYTLACLNGDGRTCEKGAKALFADTEDPANDSAGKRLLRSGCRTFSHRPSCEWLSRH